MTILGERHDESRSKGEKRFSQKKTKYMVLAKLDSSIRVFQAPTRNGSWPVAQCFDSVFSDKNGSSTKGRIKKGRITKGRMTKGRTIIR